MQAGLARQGIELEMDRPTGGPHVPLASKRDGVERILATHGPLALLRIGEALPDIRDAPVLAAFESSRTPLDAIERWRRLEVFAHSRHRTEVMDAEARRVVLRHYSIRDGEPPKRSEDLLIFGVLVALIAWVSASGLRARPTGDAAWCLQDAWEAPPIAEDCSCWIIEWDEAAAPSTPDDAQAVDLTDLIRSDLLRRWTIGAAAKEIGASTRTLQRRLQARGGTFSQLVADIRASAAVRLLSSTDRPLGEIGFLCGYADQAHFARSFKAAMAVTPRTFRTISGDS
ncbi:MAG: helix-turn-helix transcriptional regulator [Pseudomonadota bacterium]